MSCCGIGRSVAGLAAGWLAACAAPSAPPTALPHVEAATVPALARSGLSPAEPLAASPLALAAPGWRATSHAMTTAPSAPPNVSRVEDADPDAWDVRFAPYLWATNINGHLTAMGQTVDVDSSFGDLLESVDYALQGSLDISRDGVSFLGDYTYIVLDVDTNAGPVEIDAGGHVAIAQAAVALDVNDDPTFALFGGVRHYDVTVKPSLTPGPSLSGSQKWIDPIVGARKIWPLEGDWAIQAIGDVGGYVGGNSSDLTWQAAVMGVRETDHGNLILGYRVLFVDYEDGSGASEFEFDNTLFGPVVGWVFRF